MSACIFIACDVSRWRMRVASIDVGVLNLAIVVADVSPSGDVEAIVTMERIDTTEPCTHMDTCPLGHTRTATDRLSHVVKHRQAVLDTCTLVLIERQPPTGLTDVEQLLFAYFRDRAVLVSPNAMHKHFGIGNYTYEVRKWCTVTIAQQLLEQPQFEKARATFAHLGERQHDVADALCLLLFHLHTLAQSRESSERPRDTKSKKTKVSAQMLIHPETPIDKAEPKDDITPEQAFQNSIQRFVYKPSQKLFGRRPT